MSNLKLFLTIYYFSCWNGKTKAGLLLDLSYITGKEFTEEAGFLVERRPHPMFRHDLAPAIDSYYDMVQMIRSMTDMFDDESSMAKDLTRICHRIADFFEFSQSEIINYAVVHPIQVEKFGEHLKQSFVGHSCVVTVADDNDGLPVKLPLKLVSGPIVEKQQIVFLKGFRPHSVYDIFVYPLDHPEGIITIYDGTLYDMFYIRRQLRYVMLKYSVYQDYEICSAQGMLGNPRYDARDAVVLLDCEEGEMLRKKLTGKIPCWLV